MEEKEPDIRDIILNSKPMVLYGYTIIGFTLLFGLGFSITFLTEGWNPGTAVAAISVCIVFILGYIFRMFISRNIPSLRSKIESSGSTEEAWRLMFGGWKYAIVVLAIAGIVFFSTLPLAKA